jgi:hypothetical protein
LREDHAESKPWSAMAVRPDPAALQPTERGAQ